MDGKILVICDEMPGEYEGYSVKDSKYLLCPVSDLCGESIICVAWDSIIPEDRSFIKDCKRYAKFGEKPPFNFVFSKKGSVDPRGGTIKDSIQEESYLKEYMMEMEYLQGLQAEGKEYRMEALELSSQYETAATQRFFKDFSRMLSMNGIVSILPCFSEKSDENITNYRKTILSTWKEADIYMRENSSHAEVRPVTTYTDFRDIYFKKALDEELRIIGMPDFDDECL